MAKLEKVPKHKTPEGKGVIYKFKCPGCGQWHRVDNRWNFNNDLDNPTFKPSLLYTTGHYIQNNSKGDCWCDYKERTGKDAPFECLRCHSYVTDGRIRFLNDCSHELAGQTIELPEIE